MVKKMMPRVSQQTKEIGLAVAAWRKREYVVRYLVEQGVDPNSVYSDSTPTIQFAALSGNHRLIKFLVEKGANINQMDKWNYNAVHCCVLAGRVDSVRLVVSLGGDWNSMTKDKQTPLQIATKEKANDLVKFFMTLNRR